MKIYVGGTYLTRAGQRAIVEKKRRPSYDSYPFVGKIIFAYGDETYDWAPNGQYILGSGFNQQDLVTDISSTLAKVLYGGAVDED